METIFALATAPGKSGVAVVRISGSEASAAAASLGATVPNGGRGLRRLSGPDGVLDEALVLHFPKGQSFTGEDTVELHLHGSPAIIQAVLSVLGDIPGLRLAEPGEFTRRAMEAGRLDLSQVEALADLIEAETESQRRLALRVFDGALGDKVETWRSALIRAAALLEATIDFADEEVPEDVTPEVQSLLGDVTDGMTAELSGLRVAERIRTGFEVAIVGPPNAGKSTLLNYLAGRDAAITSEIAGTTRDVIEVRMDLGGLPVTLLDTAGLREAKDHVEGLGIARARERAEQADLRIFLVDEGDDVDLTPQAGDIVARPKADRTSSPDFAVSGVTGAGVDELVAGITAVLSSRAGQAGLATRERHRVAMTRCLAHIAKAEQLLGTGDLPDLAAEELRTAVRAADSLLGRIDVEAILDEIFSSFCLGK